MAAQTPSGATRQKIRVLIAKPGLDGHDRGAKIIARALRDAGMEVIYTGLHQTPEMIAEAALQEDVDAVGLSILSGAHMALFPRVMEELRKRGLDDVLVYAGGIIPDADIPEIKRWASPQCSAQAHPWRRRCASCKRTSRPKPLARKSKL